MIRQFALSALVAAATLFVSQQEEAKAQGFGAFTINNPTAVPVVYDIRWGGGLWNRYVVAPFSSRSHAYPRDVFGVVPTPQIRFDFIAGDLFANYRFYNLQTWTSFFAGGGNPYYFSLNGPYLDLID